MNNNTLNTYSTPTKSQLAFLNWVHLHNSNALETHERLVVEAILNGNSYRIGSTHVYAQGILNRIRTRYLFQYSIRPDTYKNSL